jgi:hypothetical protein
MYRCYQIVQTALDYKPLYVSGCSDDQTAGICARHNRWWRIEEKLEGSLTVLNLRFLVGLLKAGVI